MTHEELANLVNPCVGNRPNLNPLAVLLREMNNLCWNQKVLANELALRHRTHHNFKCQLNPERINIVSKPTQQEDLESVWAEFWLNKMHVPMEYDRKLWERVFVCQALWEHGALEGKDGIGFACGSEPLPSLFASSGCYVTATDAPYDIIKDMGWDTTGQYAQSKEKLYYEKLIVRELFDINVKFEHADMNTIPEKFKGQYDFTWSICALEHLGTLRKGVEFIFNSLECLKPGGIAVHTTEWGFASNQCVDNWPTVLYTTDHLKQIFEEAKARGYDPAPMSFELGDGWLDKYIDLPPWQHDNHSLSELAKFPTSCHLKLSMNGLPSTCYGIIIRKPL